MSMAISGFYGKEQEFKLRDDLKVIVQQNEVVIEGSKELIEEILK